MIGLFSGHLLSLIVDLTAYSYQMFGETFVHPTIKTVFPVVPKMLLQQAGSKKNDSERNAAIRYF